MPINGSPNIRRDPPEGDMLKSIYDTDESDKVDDTEDSEKLEGSSKAEVQDHVTFSISIPINTPEYTGNRRGTFPFAPAFAGTISEVYLMAKSAAGLDKTLTVDVNKNGWTIFTTQAKRPSLSGANTEATSGTPNVPAFVKNDKFTIDVDVSTAGTAIADVVVLIRGTQTPS